jgi:RHS repeat-associated protein
VYSPLIGRFIERDPVAGWSDVGSAPPVGNTFLYASREPGTRTELQHSRAPYYDADLGRFVSGDPVQADDNLYRYCRNRALSATDPKGECIYLMHDDRAFGLHKMVAVDTWDWTTGQSAGKRYFEFYTDDNPEDKKAWKDYPAATKWLGWAGNIPAARYLTGHVGFHSAPSSGETVDQKKITTKKEDLEFLNKADAFVGKSDRYGLGYTCREFADKLFAEAPGK